MIRVPDDEALIVNEFVEEVSSSADDTQVVIDNASYVYVLYALAFLFLFLNFCMLIAWKIYGSDISALYEYSDADNSVLLTPQTKALERSLSNSSSSPKADGKKSK
eukprot:TRINITY_DN1316_c0_g1_i1.p1 TRINITY_DN1316_c0_g1~~TRINITY_DN1316_c0_g1_i1.p1  ORF type:complete len:106 (+),score=11.87 TRINITY_DN1316_c0_g1_i1:79-396(+)